MADNVYTDPTPAITGENMNACSGNTFTCNICKITIVGVIPFNKHLMGNKHEKRLTKLHFRENGEQKVLPHFQPSSDTPFVLDGVESDIKACSTGHVVKFECTKLEEQLRKIQVAEERVGGALKNPDEHPDTFKTETCFSCSTCKKNYPTLKVLKEHLAGKAHKSRFLNLCKQEVNASNSEISNQMALSGENPDDPNFFVCCRFCHSNFTGPIPFQQHLMSEAHKKKVRRAELENQMKSAQLHDNETLHPKEHREPFCASNEFVKSSSHSKLKIKQELILKLLHEYPEVKRKVPGSGLHGQPNEGSREDTALKCSMCHNYFNGPESAFEHCKSRKHIKAKNAFRKQLQAQSPERCQ